MHESPCGTVLVQTSRVDNLEEWQKRQNGDLREIHSEFRSMRIDMDKAWGILSQRIDRLEEHMISLERWIMGTLAAALCGVGVAVINILAR